MENKMNTLLGIVGLGNMGGALLDGILNSGLVSREKIGVFDIDLQKTGKYEKIPGINIFYNLRDLIVDSKYILLAVKPQNILDIIPDLKESCNIKNSVIISIAAGITTAYYEENIGDIAVLRVMPNTPALYGKGVFAVSGGKYTSREDIAFLESLLDSLGLVILIDEKLQNLATAISGSGPAYFFLFCRMLIDFAEKNGLNIEFAQKLVVNTMIGAGEVLKSSGKPIDELIKSVASPGGTTEKALEVFNKNNLAKIFDEAVGAAQKRSSEMELMFSKK